METTQLNTRDGNHLIHIPNYDEAVRSMQQRRDLITTLMGAVLKEGTHFGKIPGCGDKPSLFLAGAEQLSASFQFCPRYKITRTREAAHLTVDITCELYTPDGMFIGEGVGTCSTYESKYRWRPTRSEEPTGNPVPKNYWDLRKTDATKAQNLIGGKGYRAKKDENNAWMIVKVTDTGEREENPDLADLWNTILKMSAKRAFVHAVRTATGTADVWTQDLEDFQGTYGAILDAEVEVYVPGLDAAKPEPPKPEPPKEEPKKPAPVPQAEKQRPAPEDRPKPEDVKKNAEGFVDGVSPAEDAPKGPVKDPFGNPIPAIDSEAFPDYATQRLNNACGLFANQYIKMLTEGTADEKKEKARAQAVGQRDTVLKAMQKENKFSGDESQHLKKVMLAEAMERRYRELFPA